MELASKVAIVTGAGSGIGRATALRLAREGASVVVNDIADDGGRETVAMIEASGGRAAFVHGDVSSENDVRSMIAFAEETFGGLDVLVNNAGVYISAPYFPNAPVERWSRVLDVYLRGVMLCTHYGIECDAPAGRWRNREHLVRRGHRLRAARLAGVRRREVGRRAPDRCARPLARSDNIRVNCVCPGWVDTPASQRTVREMSKGEWPASDGIPETMRTPDEIADAVVQLISDDSLAGRVMLYYEGEERRLLPVSETA